MVFAETACEARRVKRACAVVGGVSFLAATAFACSSSEPAPPLEGCADTASNALRTCAGPATLTGIDVSVYQGDVDWPKVRGAGRTFAFARISAGITSPDSKFARNWPAMKAAGIVRGPYQYFRPSQDVAAQARMVVDKLAAAGGLETGDLPPVLDLETADGLSSDVVVANARMWLKTIESALGIRPIVYTAAFMSNVIGTSFEDYTLWVANYGVTCPTMPSGWSEWSFWQTSASGRVPGVVGDVDTDVFNGSLARLQSLTVGGSSPDAGLDGAVTADVATPAAPPPPPPVPPAPPPPASGTAPVPDPVPPCR